MVIISPPKSISAHFLLRQGRWPDGHSVDRIKGGASRRSVPLARQYSWLAKAWSKLGTEVSRIFKGILLNELLVTIASAIMTAVIVNIYESFGQEKKIFLFWLAALQIIVAFRAIEAWKKAKREKI